MLLINSYKPSLKKEFNRLIETGVLKKINNSQSVAPTFIVAKIKGTLRFISNFKALNKTIKRKPFPIPKTQHFYLN